MATIRLAFDAHTIGSQATGNEAYAAGLIEGTEQCAFDDLQCVYYTGRDASLSTSQTTVALTAGSAVVRLALEFPVRLRKDKVDVAHFQYIGPLMCPVPQVLTVHDLSFLSHPDCFPLLMRKRLQWLVPISIRQAAHIVTVSESSRQDLIQTYALPEDKVSTVYNGVSRQFSPANDAEMLRVREKFACHDRYILVVGALQPRKNLLHVITSYAEMVKSGDTRLKLVIAGPKAWKQQSIPALLQSLGISEHVVVTGYIDDTDLVALYSAAEFSVYLSLFEGFGLPIVESMACGTPVITSNVSSMPEVSGDAAMLLDPQDKAGLQNTIRQLDTDSGLLADLRQRGLDNCQRFSWQQAAQQMHAIYHKVVADAG